MMPGSWGRDGEMAMVGHCRHSGFNGRIMCKEERLQKQRSMHCNTRRSRRLGWADAALAWSPARAEHLKTGRRGREHKRNELGVRAH
jgi:hypothetical protein